MNQLKKTSEGDRNLNKSTDREITKAIYLVGTTRGLYAGHAAVILVDKQGNGVLFSSQFELSILGEVANGKWIPYELFRKELSADDIKKYFKTGKIPLDSENKAANAYLGDYDKYISIPVPNKYLGKFMLDKAEDIHKNPGLFNLYERNCNHLCQEILASGGLNFTPTRGSNELVQEKISNVREYIKEWKLLKAMYYSIEEYRKLFDLGIIPNGAFEKGVEMAKKNNYEYGYIGRRRPVIKESINVEKNWVAKLNSPQRQRDKGMAIGM